MTVIAGAAGAGKTFFGCQLAADAARQRQYRVILAMSGYERPELMRWRLDQAQGDAQRVVFARLTPPKGINDRRQKPTDEEINERLSILYHTIEATADPKSGMLPEMSVVSGPLSVENGGDLGCNGQRTADDGPQPVRLVVIDDVDGWFGAPGGMLPAAALARIIERLNELAVTKHVAIVVLVRVQLSVEGRVTARQLGRVAHAASVMWMVAREREAVRERVSEGETEGQRDDKETRGEGDKEIENPKSRRWLLPVKNNLAEDGAMPGLAFELVEGRIRWRKTETVPELAEVLLPSIHNNDRRRLRRAACEWLQEALSHGPVASGEIIQQALSCGISRGTLNRALTDLGVKSHKTGFNGGWEMRWTEQPAPPRREPLFGPNGGFRIVGAEEWATEQGEKETRGQGEWARERGGNLDTERQRDGETAGEGEDGSGPWAMDSEQPHASCASSEEAGDSSMSSCAPSTERAEMDGSNCASSKQWRFLAGASRPHPGPLPKAEGVDARMSCASSEKSGDCLMASCASSEQTSNVRGSDSSQNPKSPAARKAC